MQGLVQAASNLYQSAARVAESILFTREQRFNRDRNIEMRNLYSAGEVSSADIMRATFGVDGPNGLDLEYLRDSACSFYGLNRSENFSEMSWFAKKKFLTRVAGTAQEGGKINVHPRYETVGKPMSAHEQNLTRIIAHEHLHSMQFEDRRIGWGTAFDNSNMAFLTTPYGGQNLWDKSKGLVRAFTHAVMDIKPTLEWGRDMNIKNYLAKEHEIQARMHEVMVEGYASWQKMPTTKVELWAALESAGMDLPRSVRKEMKSAEGRQARRDFCTSDAAQGRLSQVVEQLSLAEGFAVFKDEREKFWEKAVPSIYGNLIELYGDKEGRARMGLGTNPVIAKEILRSVMDAEEISVEDAAEIVGFLPPEHADRLMTALVNRGADGTNAQRVMDALFENDATRAALFDHTAFLEDGENCGLPAWANAFNNGDTALLQKYVDHGFAFDTTCRMKNMACEFEVDVCMLIKAQRHNAEILAKPDEAKLAKPVVKAFGRATILDNVQEALDKQQISTQFLLDCGVDIDTPRRDTDGNVSSIRDAAAEFGLYPQAFADEPSVKTGSDDTVHM